MNDFKMYFCLDFSGVHVALSVAFCAAFCRSLFVLLTIALPVILRITVSDYHFGPFNPFLMRPSSDFEDVTTSLKMPKG